MPSGASRLRIQGSGCAERCGAGPASAVAPFAYSSLVWATAAGLLVFGEWPELTTFLGAGVIIASGLFIFHGERRAARAA